MFVYCEATLQVVAMHLMKHQLGAQYILYYILYADKPRERQF